MRKPALFVLFLCLLLPLTVSAQKKPLDHSVYDSWKGSVTSVLSRDGVYLVWGARPQKGDPEMHLVHLAMDRSTAYPRGTAPRFTHDNRFLLMTVVPAQADVDQARKDKKKPEEMPKNSLRLSSLWRCPARA